MKFYLLTYKTMTKKSGILTAVAAVTVLTTSPVSADTNNQTEQQKIEQKVVSKKAEQIACATKLACETLSNSIQAQIDELEKKGEENLSDKEIDKYIALQEELITLKDSTIAVEKKETADNENLIAEKKRETQQVYNEVNSNLLSIKGSL